MSGLNIYPIEFPAIKSASVFYFNTPSGLRYEVRFGRFQDNILHATIVFGVVNDEFDGEEYSTTNRGEVFGVMRTIAEITRYFINEHPKINIFEFSAIDEPDEKVLYKNARMLLYERYLPQIFDNAWDFKIEKNKATVRKK